MTMIAKIKQYFKARNLKNKLAASSWKKLNIGSGPDGASPEYQEWVCIDKEILDITNEQNWLNFVGGKSTLDNILAEHVWEHLTDEDTQLANKNCFEFLKPGGRLRIAVPDGFNIDKQYIENVKPGGLGVGSDDHKILYTYKTMVDRLSTVGFEVSLVEYWNDQGVYITNDWQVKDGFIKRSKKYDPRNQSGKLGYTSLVVDAIKPLV
jgi:predicted SAM-dependent methyltransferase